MGLLKNRRQRRNNRAGPSADLSTRTYLERELLRLSTAGSVDDGKSTLIGRLLYDSKMIFEDQLGALEQTRLMRGEEEINLAYLLDGLKAEREQGITIDVAYRYFSTPKRKFIIADTPGHEQYTRNMVTGASTANLAIILVDARNGLLVQSKRHMFISSLLGIPHIVVAVNKMDLVGYSREVFDGIVKDFLEFAQKLNVHDLVFIPISALKGDNVVTESRNMPWYDGPTVMYHLENVTIASDRNLVDFRYPVQYVVRPHQDFRGFAGKVFSGTVRKGEEIIALPSKKRSKVKEIIAYDRNLDEAFESQSVVLTLEDEIDISRGDMIVRSHNLPNIGNTLEATLCWMDDTKGLNKSTHYILQHTTKTVKAYVSALFYRIDVNTLHREEAHTLELNDIGRAEIKTAEPIFFDEYGKNRSTGSFILIDPVTNLTVAAGMIRLVRTADDLEQHSGGARESGAPVKSRNIRWERGEVTLADREEHNRHRALCVWFTGLSGAGKSTLAKVLERRLFEEGKQVFRLDGDNVRHGLCADLGFSPEDRRRNVRRVGQASKLLFDSGHIVLCSFISPYKEDRDYVRDLFPEGRFIEVYVKCDIEECKRRDPKGLYKKALTGEIPNFTGISAPYEEPEKAEIVIDTLNQKVPESVRSILECF
jgi:bifunctional enzyme CysN/CysC